MRYGEYDAQRRARPLVLNTTATAKPPTQNKLGQVRWNLQGPQIRHDTLQGRKYLVVPMIMITEGVHNGSAGSIYYPGDELEKTPEVWNTKPIVIYHPQINGEGVSACSPEVLNAQCVGMILGARTTTVKTKNKQGKDESLVKLAAEAWLEKDRLTAIDERVLNALEKGEMVEVSTGLFMDVETVENGNWRGESYQVVARNHKPDHLAILPDQKGACSIADGAGLLRLNEQGVENAWTDEARKAALEARRAHQKGIQDAMSQKPPASGMAHGKPASADPKHAVDALVSRGFVKGDKSGVYTHPDGTQATVGKTGVSFSHPVEEGSDPHPINPSKTPGRFQVTYTDHEGKNAEATVVAGDAQAAMAHVTKHYKGAGARHARDEQGNVHRPDTTPSAEDIGSHMTKVGGKHLAAGEGTPDSLGGVHRHWKFDDHEKAGGVWKGLKAMGIDAKWNGSSVAVYVRAKKLTGNAWSEEARKKALEARRAHAKGVAGDAGAAHKDDGVTMPQVHGDPEKIRAALAKRGFKKDEALSDAPGEGGDSHQETWDHPDGTQTTGSKHGWSFSHGDGPGKPETAADGGHHGTKHDAAIRGTKSDAMKAHDAKHGDYGAAVDRERAAQARTPTGAPKGLFRKRKTKNNAAATGAAGNETTHKEPTMNKEALVNKLIANGAVFNEEDREFLMSKTVEQLALLAGDESETTELDETPEPTTENAAPALVGNTTTRQPTVQEYINNAPPEIRDMLGEGLRTAGEKRQVLISRITANSASDYTKDELAKMPLRDLQRLAKLAGNAQGSENGQPATFEALADAFGSVGGTVQNVEPLALPSWDGK